MILGWREQGTLQPDLRHYLSVPTAAGGHHDLKLPVFTQDPADLPVWAHTKNCDPQLLSFSIKFHCTGITS